MESSTARFNQTRAIYISTAEEEEGVVTDRSGFFEPYCFLSRLHGRLQIDVADNRGGVAYNRQSNAFLKVLETACTPLLGTRICLLAFLAGYLSLELTEVFRELLGSRSVESVFREPCEPTS